MSRFGMLASRSTSLRSLRHTVVAAALLLSPAAPGATAQADPNALRAAVESRYLAMRQAMDHRDAGEIKALLTPDFVSIDVDGSRTGADAMIESIKKLPLPSPDTQRKTTVETISRTATDVSVEQMYERVTNPRDSSGEPHRVVLLTHSSDRWANRDGAWKLRETKTREISISRDGVQIVHKVAPTEAKS